MNEKGVLPKSKMFFHMPSNFSKKALFYLIYSGTFYCTNEYLVERNNWNSYLFMHVRKGKMRIKYEDREFIATENTFVFLNCHKPHLYQAEEDTIFDWIHFSGNASDDYFELLFSNNGCVYSINNNFVINDCMTSILDMAENDKIDEDAISIMIHKILYELKQLLNHADELHIKSIRSAIVYIENHYQDQINLTDLANCAGLSPFHFSRIFKKHMNCSPYQYLIGYRINNAKKLLHNTNLSIQEIAFACGFNSVSHFITMFKKHTNLSPKKFREIHF
ncbi:AraC family transcriptional regulator [Aeribacillus pallidus]|nr:AraC family transcriptional regulator [Aeribacillus pallidus]